MHCIRICLINSMAPAVSASGNLVRLTCAPHFQTDESYHQVWESRTTSPQKEDHLLLCSSMVGTLVSCSVTVLCSMHGLNIYALLLLPAEAPLDGLASWICTFLFVSARHIYFSTTAPIILRYLSTPRGCKTCTSILL
ncbi:hypothetical protein F5B21DRAFT_240997 [Xylaria acuta]|nr:hypothetical protein F5B21DRAFT_240997 [Xylaria acuta]